MRKLLPFFLLLLLIAAWAVFFDRATDHFIFEPSRQIYSLQAPFEEVSFPAKDETPLYALYHKADPGKPTLLFFHGNKYNIYSFQDFALPYTQKGYGLFIFDYRGYGKSAGRATETHMYEDAESALFYLTLKQNVHPKDIVLWGVALGASPALYVAAHYNKLPFLGVILQSPFTNITEMGFYMLAQKYDETPAATILPLFLKPILWNKDFDNTQMIENVRAPLLIGASQMDRTIPWTMSRALATKAPAGTRKFFPSLGAHHNPEWMEEEALSFLNQLETKTPAAR